SRTAILFYLSTPHPRLLSFPTRRSSDLIDGDLSLQPAHELLQPFVERHGRRVAHELLGRRCIRVAMTHVAGPEAARHLRLDVLAAHGASESARDLVYGFRRAAADVDGVAAGGVALVGEAAGARHVAHVGEVAPLLAVLEDQRRPAVHQPGSEYREDAGVGIRE